MQPSQQPLSEIRLTNGNSVREQVNSVKDLIVFNDHQYTKNSTNNSINNSTNNFTSQAPAVAVAPSSIGLPPLSIEEVLNDHHPLMVSDFSQDLSQTGYSPECSIQSSSVYYGNPIEPSQENFLGDDYLNFSLEQPASLASFGF